MKLTGKDFCDFLLKKHNLKEGADYKILQPQKRIFGRNDSRVRYEIGGTSDVLLSGESYNKGEIENLLTASHEVGHFINNRADEKRYKRLMVKQSLFITTIFLTVLHAIVQAANGLIFHSSVLSKAFIDFVPVLLVLNIFVIIFAYLFAKEYNKDENMAESKSKELVDKYLKSAFIQYGDSRNTKNLASKIEKEYTERATSIIFFTRVRIGFGILLFLFNLSVISGSIFKYTHKIL
ncbi:TPA: hypothetical protein ACIQN5_000409 [Bacillus cereus]